MKIVKPCIYSVKDSYAQYKKEVEKPVPYWMYREVLSRICKKASVQIIAGGTLNLQNNLGYIRIKKIKRNFMKAVPNWGESNKLKAELISKGITPKDQNNPTGEEWIVFYTDPWYLRWAWIKAGVCRVKNQTVYLFKPTANRSKTAGDNDLEKLGNRGLLVHANRLNPTLHHSYEY